VTDLDEALERFQLGALEYGPGLANHGPMAAEALVALGHPALLTGLVDLYAPRLPPFEPAAPLREDEREAALGDPLRFGSWVATWERELDACDWREVLAHALALLEPGLFAGAAHGFLRVAHAVRALGREQTGPRLRELAFGLGYWAGRYQRLPGEPGESGRRDPVEVLRQLDVVSPERRPAGLFFDAVRVLDSEPGFAAAIESADLSAQAPSALIGSLCREGARLYLANPRARVAYAHVVTVPSALRLLAPHVDEVTLRKLAGRAFQAGAALHAVSSTCDADVPPPSEDVQRTALDPHEIRYRAACSLREHSIKLAEACLRETEIEPDPILALAAADAALELEGAGTASTC